MKKIVLLRHGESAWNKENRVTGWTDVDLTEKGIAEAEKAGETLKEYGFNFVEKNWRLNEKHYGDLQGLNKAETAGKYGEEQVLIWRRSYDIAPNPLSESDLRNARFDYRYHEVPDAELPRTESLKDTIERIMPYWVAHGNSLRGIIKHLKHISDEEIVKLNLPTAVPYVFEFDENLNVSNDYFLGNAEEIKKMMEAVANQGKKK